MVAVKLDFIVERNDGEHVPWDLVEDSSTVDCDEYDLSEDINCFLCNTWVLPIDFKEAECGMRFRVYGEGCIRHFSIDTPCGTEYDVDYEGTLEMEFIEKV